MDVQKDYNLTLTNPPEPKSTRLSIGTSRLSRNNMSESFAERARIAISQSGKRKADICREMGVSSSTLASLERASTSSKYANKLADVCDVSLPWLISGEGPMKNNVVRENPQEYSTTAQLEVSEYRVIDLSDLETALTQGPSNCEAITTQYTGKKLSQSAFGFYMPDDSMENAPGVFPSLTPKTVVVVDPEAESSPANIALVKLKKNGLWVVRRLQREIDESITLTPINQSYKTLHDADIEQIVWVVHAYLELFSADS